jgi:hypothetical protein
MKKLILTEEQIKEILRLYNEELLGSSSISEKLKIHKTIILNTLKENGVKLGPSGRRFIGGREVAMKKYESKPETKERKKENHKTWSEKNRDYLNDYHQKWREKNIDKHRENKRNYEKTRKHNDPIYKLINNFRTAVYQVLKESNVQKNGHYFEILKYTPDELITHLEEKFTGEMSWDNYGIWHVDHIRPISSFNIQEIGDESFMECWSLKNLQPLWGDENIRKSNKTV